MPTYTIEAPDGRKFSLDGDSPPTEKELEQVFSTMSKSGPTLKDFGEFAAGKLGSAYNLMVPPLAAGIRGIGELIAPGTGAERWNRALTGSAETMEAASYQPDSPGAQAEMETAQRGLGALQENVIEPFGAKFSRLPGIRDTQAEPYVQAVAEVGAQLLPAGIPLLRRGMGPRTLAVPPLEPPSRLPVDFQNPSMPKFTSFEEAQSLANAGKAVPTPVSYDAGEWLLTQGYVFDRETFAYVGPRTAPPAPKPARSRLPVEPDPPLPAGAAETVVEKPVGTIVRPQQAAPPAAPVTKPVKFDTEAGPFTVDGHIESAERLEHELSLSPIQRSIEATKANIAAIESLKAGNKGDATAQPLAADWTSATDDQMYSGIPMPKFANRKMSQLDAVTAQHSRKLQQSFDESRRAERDIKKVIPSARRQNAASVYREAGGDMIVLKDWEARAKQPWMKDVAKDAQTLTPAEIAMVGKVEAAFDALETRGNTSDVLKSHRDNYIPHVWSDKPGTGWGGRVLQQRFRFSKARTLDTFFDGDQAGFKPKTLAIGKLLPAYIHEMNKVIADRQFVRDLAGKTASDKRPLVLPRGNAKTMDATQYAVMDTPGGKARKLYDTESDARAALKPGQTIEKRPASTAFVAPRGFAAARDAAGNAIEQRDYRTLENQPALHDWRWVESDPLGGTTMLKSDLALHPEAQRRLRAMLGQSAIREWYHEPVGGAAQIPRAIVRGLDTAQSAMKREMFGLLAPFHQVQEGTHGIGHRLNPFFGLERVDMRNPKFQDMANHGVMLFPDTASAGSYLQGVGTKSSLLSRGIRKIPKVGETVSDVIDGYQDYLFHQYIPALKAKTYEAMLRRNTKLYADELKSGEMKMADVKITSAEQANAAYGHLNYALLDRNPTIQHMMQLSLLAPDFLEARARFAGQAAKGLTSKVGHEQLKAIAVLASVQAGTAFILSQLLGVPYDVKHPFELVYKGRRYAMRSVPEDIYSLLKDTRQFTYSRVNPLIVKSGIQLATGLNYRGEKASPLDTFEELLAGYIPLTARSLPGLRSLTETSRNNPVSPLQQLAGSLGLRVSRYSPISETYKLAGAWMDDQKMDRSKGVFPISKYQKLRYALEDGDMDKAAIEYDDLRKTMNAYEIATGLNQSVNHPFTGNVESDRNFRGSLTGSDRQLYDLAVHTRSSIMTAFRSLPSVGAQPSSAISIAPTYLQPTRLPEGATIGAP